MNDFSPLIVDWYRQNHRLLPWRETRNPYFIWLSEIILQQTRVDQGLKYYTKFIQNYPTVESLATANEKDVLNDWQGLGYYSRARNLHFSAKYIVNDLNGEFPNSYKELLKLKGVGKYTAAAIASFAFKEKHAVVDGNVYRILSRVFDINTPIDSTTGIKEFQSLASELISPIFPDEHNQAIMELGAVICTPIPRCSDCPLSEKCLSLAKNIIRERPVKSKKIKVKDRYFHYLIFNEKNETVIEKRTKKDIWQNMYQFPLIETSSSELELKDDWKKYKTKESTNIKHILSHQKIYARFHHFSVILPEFKKGNDIIKWDELQDFPLPRLIDRYLENKDQL